MLGSILKSLGANELQAAGWASSHASLVTHDYLAAANLLAVCAQAGVFTCHSLLTEVTLSTQSALPAQQVAHHSHAMRLKQRGVHPYLSKTSMAAEHA